jgi:hypothetical protein
MLRWNPTRSWLTSLCALALVIPLRRRKLERS